ncbi:uncharacterized protein LOC143681201 isoform X2 [Tamandua tetradactyla]|uniref:uncharacterized protein LOC143681201 isoform X2 n=1 Tax=Tamandua tetradactyla TaxID=48850 RepID=UPI004053A4E3
MRTSVMQQVFFFCMLYGRDTYHNSFSKSFHRVAPLEEEPNAEVALETSLNSEVASRTLEKAPLEDLAEEAPRDRAAEDAASNDKVTLNANDKGNEDWG